MGDVLQHGRTKFSKGAFDEAAQSRHVLEGHCCAEKDDEL
jgi:hypothetical protein